MDLIDFKLENGRIVFDDTGDIVFVKGAERVRQQVEFRLSLWQGEWFLDSTFGTPYMLRILGKAAVSIDAAVDALRQQILDVEGVQAISRLDYDFDAETRKLVVDTDIVSAYGIVEFKSMAQLGQDDDPDRTAIDMRATELDSRVTVNVMPAHGVRTVGNKLFMTNDGEYPVEMLNNVQVGRQLPVQPLTAMPFSLRMFQGAELNTLYADNPVDGIKGYLFGATVAATPTSHYMRSVFEASQLKAGGKVRVESFVKQYQNSNRRVTVEFKADPAATYIAAVGINPVNGQITSASAGAADVIVTAYGGNWWRITYTVTWPAAYATSEIRLVMTDALGNAQFTSTGNYSDAVITTQGTVYLDTGALPSVRPDGVYTSPMGSVSIAKMYAADSVRVSLSNGAYIDLQFGNADHVDLPVNLYNVGVAFITRIEYRG